MSDDKHDAAEWAKDREVCEKATPGPWHRNSPEGQAGPVFVGYYAGERRRGDTDIALVYQDWTECGRKCFANAAFVARARTRWPAALDEIARLRAEVKSAADKASDRVTCESAEDLFDLAHNIEVDLRALLAWEKQGGR